MKKRMQRVLAERAAGLGEWRAACGDWPLAEPFAIGGVTIANRVVVAPLAGIGNWAYRRQARRHGAGLAMSEMVTSFGLAHGNARTREMLTIAPDERPVGIQLFGMDPAVMAEAARVVEAAGADLVDVNMGCPVRKVCRTGAGAALLDDPARAASVVTAMVDAVRIPVTVKMRRGRTPATSRPAEFARRMEAAGAAAITVHPRAAEEEYAGVADHAITAAVAAAVSVPVIASGDITNARSARDVLDATGCAAVAIGRGALGNPWLFRQLATGRVEGPPGRDAVVDEILAFAGDLRLALGDRRAAFDLRKFYGWYLAGFDVPTSSRDALLTEPSVGAALEQLDALRTTAAPVATIASPTGLD